MTLFPGAIDRYDESTFFCRNVDAMAYHSKADSYAIARYMEETNSQFKPWLLVQLRLKKLQERKASLSTDEYLQQLNDIHTDLMNLGEWWVGREDEVFGDDEPLLPR